MKIGILTFHCAVNYGAVLQAYGLQEYLRSLGHEVYVIDYRPDYLTVPYRPFKYSSGSYSSVIQRIKGLVRACLVYPICRKRNKNFSGFINKELKLYKLDFDNRFNDFDAFIFGSDQIWNPRIPKGIDEVFIGKFPAALGKRLIAYAPSVGSVKNLCDEDLVWLEDVINHFKMISVREQSLAAFIRNKFNKEVISVLDPVLLAGSSVFERIVAVKKVAKPYLLLFQIWKNEQVSLYAEKAARKMGMQFVEIVSWSESVKDRSLKQYLSPEEFLGYFKNASYVITSSFHGTAFSILFKKNFNVVRSDDLLKDERAFSLLKSLGMENRMCSVDTPFTCSDVDYSLAEEKLQEIRKSSVKYLEQALSE